MTSVHYPKRRPKIDRDLGLPGDSTSQLVSIEVARRITYHLPLLFLHTMVLVGTSKHSEADVRTVTRTSTMLPDLLVCRRY